MAVAMLNSLKDDLNKQVKYLADIKLRVTNCSTLNQGDKSRLRIQIESLLIDLNEEIFNTTEVLASAFSSAKPQTHELVLKAHSIEERKIYLSGKVKQCIT